MPTHRPALRIALWFALFGAIWILVSDRVVLVVTRDPEVLGRLQTAKGWLFVGISAVFVYLLAARDARLWQSDHDRLRRARKRLEAAQRLAGLGHWTLVLETGRIYGSAEFFRLMGLTPADGAVSLDQVLEVVHPDDRDRIAALHGHRRNGDGDGEAFHRIVTRDGAIRWVHERAHAERAADGSPKRLIGTTQDITDLRRAEREARASRDRLEALIQASPMGICVLDAEGRVLRWNPAAETIFGWSETEVLGGPVPFEPGANQGEFDALIGRVRRGEVLQGRVLRRRRKDGTELDISLSTGTLVAADGRYVGAVALVEDVTERIRASQELEETKLLLERTFESLAEAVFLVKERRIVDCNPAAERMFGRTRESMLGRSTRLIHRDEELYLAFGAEAGDALAATGKFRAELTLRRGDGSTFPGELAITLLDPDRGLAGGVVSVARDLSERRAAERQRQRFYEGLQLAREEERKRLSREVHDELGQALTGLKMDLGRLKTMPECAEVRPRLAEMDDLLDGAIRDVRRIATELRPGILDDFGLEAALEWLCDDVARRSDLDVVCRCALRGIELDDGRTTQVFRIAQEALTNVQRHARARRAGVELTHDAGTLRLTVWDDGRGLDPNPDRRPSGLGLVGMGERAALMSGTLTFETPEGGGTRVVATLPLERRAGLREDDAHTRTREIP